jgi:hypothetical protein
MIVAILEHKIFCEESADGSPNLPGELGIGFINGVGNTPEMARVILQA